MASMYSKTTLIRLVFMLHINAIATPTNDINYTTAIYVKVVELV